MGYSVRPPDRPDVPQMIVDDDGREAYGSPQGWAERSLMVIAADVVLVIIDQ